MTRAFFCLLLACGAPAVNAEQKKQQEKQSEPKSQEPPEEDQTLIQKEYSFNPLQAARELKIGEYYFKKGNWTAAGRRFSEATKWNPGLAEAWLRLGDAREKVKDEKGAREAWAKYLGLAPDAKNAEHIRKKIGEAKK